MLRIIMLLFVFGSGYLTAFSAIGAAGTYQPYCKFEGGNLVLSVPRMSIPSDTPDGTVLYSSPKMTRKLICGFDGYTTFSRNFSAVTTADYNNFSAIKNGVRFTLYINGVPFDKQMNQSLGTIPDGDHPEIKMDLSIWYDVKVDSSMGKIPVEGTLLSGGFESVYMIVAGSYSTPRGVISIMSPDITFIPCVMDVSVNPDTINFGDVRIDEMDKGMKLKKNFSTVIKKSKGCLITYESPFSLNLFFEPTNPMLNADGSLNLNNGLGLSITDKSGKRVSYNEAWKVDNVKVSSVLKSDFSANLQKISGQDIKTGPFSADVVVRLNYY
ncbi:fimbrial protein [Citrobacter cronae]|uniref:fimbrial protein n=1 Tax=Citrobacter cronae TaxID=1748967 RepID=UPI001C11B374|nr:fimbrial protein [Citrobacter cronae]MBU5388657.1 fimbrial protein [Citrobacter cronae]